MTPSEFLASRGRWNGVLKHNFQRLTEPFLLISYITCSCLDDYLVVLRRRLDLASPNHLSKSSDTFISTVLYFLFERKPNRELGFFTIFWQEVTYPADIAPIMA